MVVYYISCNPLNLCKWLGRAQGAPKRGLGGAQGEIEFDIEFGAF